MSWKCDASLTLHASGVAFLRKTTPLAANREVSQIGNVDADVNVDIQSHPVGHNPPQILVFFSYFEPNSTFTLTFS